MLKFLFSLGYGRFSVFVIAWFLNLTVGWNFSWGKDFSYQIRCAVFSNQHYFWPDLAQKSVKPEKGAIPVAATSPIRLGVLPVHITQYRESIPCDSCHRLSANGMEFYLENYFKDKLAARFPNAQVELLAPHLKLVENQKMDLMAFLDSLQFPWTRWFPDSDPDSLDSLIYRPRDRWTTAKTRQSLDRLGGSLNEDYLLLPTDIDIYIKPLFSNVHTGGFSWSFNLLFWNVRESRVEWAMRYRGSAGLTDLDKSLDSHLDHALGGKWDRLPMELQALWKAEPR